MSENAEVLAGIDLVRSHTQGRGIWAIDRGGDRKKLLEPLLDRGERFVIRSTGKRFVVDRKNIKRSVTELGAKCRLRHQARIVKIQDGQEKTYDLRYGVEPIRRVGRDERMHLVVLTGFGEEPILLLTNALKGARDSQLLWWIAQIYLMRWKIEETFRFIKQSYNLEDIRVMKYQRLKNLVAACDSCGLLCRDLHGTEDEASHPVRKAADHLAALLRHSPLPVLCPGRRNQENSLSNQSRRTREIASESTVGTAARLGGTEILRKLLSKGSFPSIYDSDIPARRHFSLGDLPSNSFSEQSGRTLFWRHFLLAVFVPWIRKGYLVAAIRW